MEPEVLLVAGRSGSGKSSVAFELSARWQRSGLAHCLVDGDNLDAAYPKPPSDPRGTALTEANLRAVWGVYAAAGYRRVVYVNTVSVLERELVTRALGGRARVSGVLLTASAPTIRERLGAREVGSELRAHLDRSAAAAELLDRAAGPWVTRVATDGRTVADLAATVAAASGWEA
ncbi:adenylyl-sulfate kinase [Cellulomonas sp.]|uniref:adenylyl-sulfate kinase n=1 Tax=Cellulomonas sp. TaxID=40001 RepID=UPI002D35E789|nr:adenylyl-sulfate kinase [Cellulomonas sp.]HYQ77424.1 adenylyl-sulfate kinase [Cellulomonas sp.]